LGGGMPAPELLPVSGLRVELKNNTKLDIDPKLVVDALQYSSTDGLPELREELKALQKRQHNPSYDKWDIIVTTGSQDGLAKVFRILFNRGDTIITENPTYSDALTALRPMGVNIIGIDTDHQGLKPEHLEETLANFNQRYPTFKKPKALYTIPTGQNPGGSTVTLERRKRIYQIACKYNFLILEDDPYWYIRLLPTKGESLSQELKSYLSMDTEQRVIRFDSFSKIISSGARIGFTTGHSSLIEKILFDQGTTALHTSGISQVLILTLLKKWGPTGFDNQIQAVQKYYTSQRDAFLSSASKYLTGLCEWNCPMAGLFVWIKVLGVKDTYDLIQKKAFSAGVVMLPGRVFSPTNEDSPYVRASFSIASPEQIDQALLRFSNILRGPVSKI
jgi:kynurenine/2-aminoadipate aminotransferase